MRKMRNLLPEEDSDQAAGIIIYWIITRMAALSELTGNMLQKCCQNAKANMNI
jgi:hypothetical protein